MTRIVLCIDYDDDFGRKAGIKGPIIGRKENLKAAEQLGLADPEDSDVNALFYALKIYDEMNYQDKEIVTITGHGKKKFESDEKISSHLDYIMKKFQVEGFIIVSDGAEDEQILPLIQSRSKIISIQSVTVKQTKPVESAYYTITEALKNPFLARMVYGIPGIALLFYMITVIFQLQYIFILGLAGILGVYLILKGFGIEQKLVSAAQNFIEGISVMKASMPLYVGSIFLFFFGIANAFNDFSFSAKTFFDLLVALQGFYFFTVIALVIGVVGRIVDSVVAKKAILIKKYIFYAVSVFLSWLVIDSGTLVLLRQTDLNFFLISILVSFIGLIFVFNLLDAIDLSRKASSILAGLNAFSQSGILLGMIQEVEKDNKQIIVKLKEGKKLLTVKEGGFFLKDNEVIVTQQQAF